MLVNLLPGETYGSYGHSIRASDPHRSRNGRRLDFGFELPADFYNMKVCGAPWCLRFQKMYKSYVHLACLGPWELGKLRFQIGLRHILWDIAFENFFHQ